MVKIITCQVEIDELQKSGKLLVIDFFSKRCGPCVQIAPLFLSMSSEYSKDYVIFAKVDVDECQSLAAAYGIRYMPTFQFFIGSKKVDDVKKHISEKGGMRCNKADQTWGAGAGSLDSNER